MKVEEVLDVLRHYRHDWMNQLQLIYGYASMDKMDKVKEKVQEVLESSKEESKLLGLKAPTFAMWAIRFNSIYNQFRLSYHIEAAHDLSSNDEELVTVCHSLMQLMDDYKDPTKLYQVKLIVDGDNSCMITIWFEGNFQNQEQLISQLKNKSFLKKVHEAERDNEKQLSVQLLLNER